jgi:hypothetical protein
MKGPSGAVFDPPEYKVDLTKGQSCEDLVFKLQGFSLKIQVKAQNLEGKLIDAFSGIELELKQKGDAKKEKKMVVKSKTNENGNVEFDKITTPDNYEIRVIENEDITFKSSLITCDFKWESGFNCD